MTDSADFPLQQLVLKIHSRCDLACDHCYVYEHADQTWRAKPVVISPETVAAVARRLAEYAEAKSLDSISVILHGGEPLLAGPARLRDICTELKSVVSPVTALDLRMHTNGVQLRRKHLEVCREFDVKIGISLDGDRAANDRHRLDRRGRSSYDRVVQAVELLRSPEYRHLYLGLLCTVDVANDPVAVHDALTALDPPRIDYLLPHSTWDSPPPPGRSGSPTPYADWLLAVFDRWQEQGRTVPVRTFDSVLSTLRGGPSLTEAMGLAPSDLAVVETDGSFEQADSLKTAFDGAPATGYDVLRHGFEEFAAHPGVRARQSGIAGVSETCRRCPVVESCGGGLYAHRFSSERQFDNPSVFCADLKALVEGIADRITQRDLAPAVLNSDELFLAQLQLDRTLLARTHTGLAGDPDWAAAWDLLVRLDSDERTAPGLNALLTHPYLRPALHRAWHGPADLPRFMAMAAAAAVHAREPVTLGWDQPGTELHLPTLGTLALPGPGRVEVTVAGAQWSIRQHRGPVHVPAERPAEWRELTSVERGTGAALLIDDADPYRSCYPVPVSDPLGDAELAGFTARLRAAYGLLDEQRPEWQKDINALEPATVTPLAAGSGLQLGSHRLGALGVAVDIEPAAFVRALPLLGRRARLTALREVADLHVPGSRAGRLLDRASETIAEAVAPAGADPVHRRRSAETAARALDELDGEPARSHLTASGRALLAELREEHRALDD
ncbi:FxsB family radical SAM/SPASM domain protein [Streptomyces triticagri]|uniref:FxsB family radical SAM/SPASM domain protein n=1 Tax=Streptomyces triticagri TaxID=2293568 RepID=A0A372M311_9ACTN|nr:radical SAM/SPASM protein FxsB, inactivated metallohydrolase extension form [Streptomyces triticagri]RFU84697.1 FxsB family radical SAM/SPASM domain protein [Streptomyces triticagri]